MHIRPARPDDAPAILAAIRPVVAAGETYALDPRMGDDDLLAYWTAPDKRTFVAEEDGTLLGTYYIRTNQGGGGSHVCNCGYVTAEAATGRGVARRMCADSIERARALGYEAMQFNFVVSTNVRAVNLWAAMGFETVGRLPGAFRHPTLGDVDALVMYRTL
ncbi:GNAT family N-acetyltransferase [Aureimonas sp. Leaf324]|jgi:L-amino acid N-acyltransferase YncA|uniref:GNAT family N-acetyltransferase n=1 Tax=Aureimonas sp. Leaf324 TaxID=1736336 RepID=UPI0006FA04D5|nr:GNAT family N-acetyltransferase [Aureimonas sp. Leaf324]KQQ87667.1 acetyltransferase [Aureimonas sp. Leaf324]